jgi:hypothetical protein
VETFMMMMMMMMTAIIVMTRGREECEHLPMSRTWRKISVARLSWRVEQAPYPMSKNTAMDTHTHTHTHDGRLVSRNWR